jgi:hypothetical protein
LILQPELQFEPLTHTYTVADQTVPSVSQILKAGGGGADYSAVPEDVLKRAAAIGISVHKCVEDFYTTGIHPSSDDASVEAYLPGLLDFIDDGIFAWKYSELLLYHPVIWYAGTVDLIGYIDGELSIVDVKTTNKIHREAIELQTAAYAELYRFVSGQEVYRRYVLWLRRHKTYSLVGCDDPFAFSRFHGMRSEAA